MAISRWERRGKRCRWSRRKTTTTTTARSETNPLCSCQSSATTTLPSSISAFDHQCERYHEPSARRRPAGAGKNPAAVNVRVNRREDVGSDSRRCLCRCGGGGSRCCQEEGSCLCETTIGSRRVFEPMYSPHNSPQSRCQLEHLEEEEEKEEEDAAAAAAAFRRKTRRGLGGRIRRRRTVDRGLSLNCQGSFCGLSGDRELPQQQPQQPQQPSPSLDAERIASAAPEDVPTISFCCCRRHHQQYNSHSLDNRSLNQNSPANSMTRTDAVLHRRRRRPPSSCDRSRFHLHHHGCHQRRSGSPLSKDLNSCSSFLSLTYYSSSSSSSSPSSSVKDFISGLFARPTSGLLPWKKRFFRNSKNRKTTATSSSFRSSPYSSCSSSSAPFDARLPFFLFSVVALIGLTLSGSQQQQHPLRKQPHNNDNNNNHRFSSVSAALSVGSGRAGAGGDLSRQLIQVGFQTVLNETRDVPCPTVGGGEIPRWLSGYFLRHTPGTYGQENRRSTGGGNGGDKRLQYIDHLFDGLAMVSSYELKSGAVKFSNKYLETHGYKIWEHYDKDMAKSYVAWGTTFSKMNWTQAVRWRQNFTEPEYYRGNPNVNFWRIGGNIQAVDESAHGLMFDVETLETTTTYIFEDEMLAPGYNYNYFEKVIHPAHEHIDLDGSVWNVMGVFTRGPDYLFDQANWTVYRIEGENRRVSVGSTPIGEKMFDLEKCFINRHYPDYEDRAGYMHSFAMSRNYVVLPVVPYFLDYCTVFSQRRPAAAGAFFRTYMQAHAAQGLKFHVMRKSDGIFVKTLSAADEPVTMSAEKNIFVTHQINAFEEDDKQLLHVDMLTYKSPDVYQTAYIESIMQEVFAEQEATIERFTISLVDFHLVSRRPLSKPQPMEFPTINYDKYRQRDYRFTYLITRPYLTRSTIMKLNVNTQQATHWGPEEGVFPSEAVFVPTPGSTVEDDGVLLSGLLDANFRRGFILVLNATTMEEISRARAPINTPFGLHNRFFSHAEMTSSAASEPTLASPSYWPSFTSGGDNIVKEVEPAEEDGDGGDDDDVMDGVSTMGGSSRKGPTQTHVPGVATAVIIFKISCLHVFSMWVACLRHLVWP